MSDINVGQLIVSLSSVFVGAFIGFGFTILYDRWKEYKNRAKLHLEIIEKQGTLFINIICIKGIAKGLFIKLKSNEYIDREHLKLKFNNENVLKVNSNLSNRNELYGHLEDVTIQKNQKVEMCYSNPNEYDKDYIQVSINALNAKNVTKTIYLTTYYFMKHIDQNNPNKDKIINQLKVIRNKHGQYTDKFIKFIEDNKDIIIRSDLEQLKHINNEMENMK